MPVFMAPEADSPWDHLNAAPQARMLREQHGRALVFAVLPHLLQHWMGSARPARKGEGSCTMPCVGACVLHECGVHKM